MKYWKMGILALVAFGLVTAVALTAGADDPKKGKEFDFETDEVTVDVLKPDATMVEVLARKARESLIRIRLDFIPEIVDSAEDI